MQARLHIDKVRLCRCFADRLFRMWVILLESKDIALGIQV